MSVNEYVSVDKSTAAGLKPNAVIFVPGFSTLNAGQALDQMLLNSIRIERTAEITSEAPANCGGLAGRRITFGSARSVDFFEVYWLGAIERLSKAPTVLRLWLGLWTTLWFIRPRSWPGLARSRGWLAPLIGNSITFVLWFATTLATVLVAVGQVASWFPHHQLAESIKQLTLVVNGPFVLALTAVLTYWSVDANQLVDISYVVNRYLRDKVDRDGFTLNQKSAALIQGALLKVIRSKEYDRVTIVGHSFGGMLVVDSLRTPTTPAPANLHLVTLGSFFDLLVGEKSEVRERLRNCASNASIERWDDFWSPDDGFSSAKPVLSKKTTPRYDRHEAHIPSVPAYDGGGHASYFSDPAVLRSILEPNRT